MANCSYESAVAPTFGSHFDFRFVSDLAKRSTSLEYDDAEQYLRR